jgi:16S rRNA C1402 N4-methylase RsmH
MRFDNSQGQTAREYLLRVTPESLSESLQKYGDFSEIYANKIALYIIQNRRKNGLQTTNDLKKILKEL